MIMKITLKYRLDQFNEVADSAVLAPRNVDVDGINDKVLELLDEKTEKTFCSIDEIFEAGDKQEITQTITEEFLNSPSPRSLPLHELKLRNGGQVENPTDGRFFYFWKLGPGRKSYRR